MIDKVKKKKNTQTSSSDLTLSGIYLAVLIPFSAFTSLCAERIKCKIFKRLTNYAKLCTYDQHKNDCNTKDKHTHTQNNPKSFYILKKVTWLTINYKYFLILINLPNQKKCSRYQLFY